MIVKITEDNLNVELESVHTRLENGSVELEERFVFRVWRNGERQPDHNIVVKTQIVTSDEGEESSQYHLYFDPISDTEYWWHSVTDAFGFWTDLKWLTIWAMAVYRHRELYEKVNG